MRIGHTNADDIELKPALQELLLDLRGDAVKTDVAFRNDRLWLLAVRGRHCARLEDSTGRGDARDWQKDRRWVSTTIAGASGGAWRSRGPVSRVFA